MSENAKSEAETPPAASILRQLMQGMPTRFDAKRAEGLEASIQFQITGDAGGDFLVSVTDGTCSVEETRHPAPDLTLTMSHQTYFDVALGKTTGPQTFFRRQMQFTGDMNLLMKMHALFPAYRET